MHVTNRDPQLALAADLHGFFQEALVSALQERGVEVTEPTSHYLVALLADFAKPGELTQEALERPLAVLLQEALGLAGRERFERLRSLGDSVLYTSGFFFDHLETRGVTLTYVSSLGARAYGGAASMLRYAAPEKPAHGEAPRAPELFEELADNFAHFAQVLATVADGLYANASRSTHAGMLKVYERWLRTGSNQLAQALTERGILPTRGSGGVH
ncbi:MAG TPA: hypothetical protein VFQ61_18985 [Polyangiaceae bacterium]|nr:hypothetical protein [Polyangiaceae bacterium]